MLRRIERARQAQDQQDMDDDEDDASLEGDDDVAVRYQRRRQTKTPKRERMFNDE